MRIRSFLNIFAISICVLGSSSLSAQTSATYETPPIRKASAILPPALVKGEHFSVRDQVGWKEGLHLFTVD
jgi:hypothetical protein